MITKVYHFTQTARTSQMVSIGMLTVYKIIEQFNFTYSMFCHK